MRSAPSEHPAKLGRITAVPRQMGRILALPRQHARARRLRAARGAPWIAGRDAAINRAAILQANKARTPMKAILCTRFGGPDDLELKDLPDPVAGPGEVLVAVKAAALNFFDTLIIAG